MNVKNTQMTIRMNADIKDKAEQELLKYGLSVSDYIRIVLGKAANGSIDINLK